MNLLLKKPGPLMGELPAIPSKSDAHRILICAALSDRKTEIRMQGATSEDILATAACLQALGATVRKGSDRWVVSPMGGTLVAPELPCGESGSTLRFLLPIVAALGIPGRFTGAGRLPERPLSPLKEEMEMHGITFSASKLPFTLSGRLQGGVYTLPGNISSQYITGLCLALPLTGEACEIRLTTKLESASYLSMTLKTLAQFGIFWRWEGERLLLEAGATYQSPLSLSAEGDWSGMAAILTAGALSGSVTVSGLSLDSLQPDKAIFQILGKAGARINALGEKITVSKERLLPFDDDVSGHPDLFPVLAILAAGAKGDSHLRGGRRLRLKESDRIASVAALLRSLGCRVEEEEDGITVHGEGTLSGGTVSGEGDHRIVMAAALARLIAKGDITLTGAEAINKSYPTFFTDLEKIGGVSHEV